MRFECGAVWQRGKALDHDIGEVKSNGEIKWETKDLTDDKFKDLIDGPVLEEAENFLVAVKRLHDDTGLDFYFSYNNRGGERRIIIQGRI